MSITLKFAAVVMGSFLLGNCSQTSFFENSSSNKENATDANTAAGSDGNASVGSAGGDNDAVDANVEISMRNMRTSEATGEDPATDPVDANNTNEASANADDSMEDDEVVASANSEEEVSEHKNNKASCLSMHGGDKMKYLHVSSANNKVVLDDGTILALKVTGTTNVVDINLKAEEGAKIAGICIFIAGDQNAVNINVGIDTDLISIVGRGNQSEVKINVAKDISVGDVKVNLAGNKPHVLVSGEGSYSCSSTANKGNAPLLECTK